MCWLYDETAVAAAEIEAQGPDSDDPLAGVRINIQRRKTSAVSHED